MVPHAIDIAERDFGGETSPVEAAKAMKARGHGA